MAVSGRKQTDMLGSIAVGSAEDFECKCEPCLTMGQHKEARGFCVQCQEYLCKTCEDCHKKTKVSKNHQILGRDGFDKLHTTRRSNNECTEKCSLHQKEIIKFYCPRHATLCCNDCMTIGHRACEIDYIPDKCAGIADDKEYKDIVMKLSEKLKEAERISKKFEYKRCEINDINKEVIKKIEEFRAEINDRLDQMQRDILNNVEGKKSNNKQIVQKVVDTCGNIISDVKKLQSSLRSNESKNEMGQLYIDIKRAESALRSDELTKAKDTLMNMNIQFSFRRSADLENLLSKEIVFGELINHHQRESTKKKKTIDHLTIKNDINVKTKSDTDECYITGCAVLPSSKLVLADYNDNKIKVVSVKNKHVLLETILDSKPLDIAVMSENQFAVTIPDKRRIDIMTTDDKLSRDRSIKVNRDCYCIDFHQDRFYVVCSDPPSAVLLTTQGNVLSNIPLNFFSSYSLPYISVRKDSKLLYISDFDNNNVVSVSLQGDIFATYKHEDLQGPRGMCLLDDGSLLVCCFSNGTIHQMKHDLKEGKKIYKDITYPCSICYSRLNDEVYVGCYVDQLKVLSIK